MVIMTLEKTSKRPEKMRVYKQGFYTVESFSENLNCWIVQKVWSHEVLAIEDCINWYGLGEDKIIYNKCKIYYNGYWGEYHVSYLDGYPIGYYKKLEDALEDAYKAH